MKTTVLLTVLILVSPFAAIGILLFYNINVFDNPDFWYGYMAFFGTVLLGAVAISQSHKANMINDRLLDMQEELQRFQIKEKAACVDIEPVITDKQRGFFVVNDDETDNEFDVVNQEYEYFFFLECPDVNREKGRLFNMVFELKNISDNVIKEIYIEDLKIFDIITNVSGVAEEKENIREYFYEDSHGYAQRLVRPNEKIRICLKIDMDEYDMANEAFCVNFNLSTMSVYNVIFSENVTLQRNNVVDTKDRVFVKIDRCYFVNMPEAI